MKKRTYWITRDDSKSEYIIWDHKPRFFIDCWGGLEDIPCDEIYYETFESIVPNIRLKGGKDSIVKITGFRAMVVR